MNEIQIKQMDGQAVMDSRDVAKMVEKRHTNLIRDIRDYIKVLDQNSDLSSDQFFIKSSYRTGTGKNYTCYLLTKQGCEFVANKMTGKKGTLFTARYVSIFNEYQERQQKQLTDGMSEAELAIRRQELAYKKEWLEEMKRQNRNKEHELRNEDVKLMLQIADLADDRGEFQIATDYRREAIKTLNALPMRGDKRLFAANEIAQTLGVDAYTIGTWGRKLSLVGDEQYTKRGEFNQVLYYSNTLRIFKDHAREIQDYYAEKRLGV